MILGMGVTLFLIGASPYPVWQEIYDGGKTDMAHGMCLDSADHIRLIGETNQALDYDSWMIVVSKSGDSLWSLLYDDGHDEKGFSIATTREGNIAVATVIDRAATQTSLYDPNGELLWKRKSSIEEVARVIATADNKIYISGWDTFMDEHPIITIGYNEEGESVLYLNIPGGNPGVSDLVVDPLGYIYIGLYKGGPCAIWKYSPEGELVWFRNYGSVATRGFGLEINDADHLFQAGDIASVSTTVDFLLLKWDTSGRLFWNPGKNYDLGHNEYCRDIKLDEISDCYLAGYQIRGSERDAAIVKTDSAGNMLWGWVDTLEGKQEIEGIEVDEEGYIYLAGSHHNGENWDILVMKIAQPLTITGRVTDSTGAPMEGIPVSLSGDTTVEVLTDTGGYYFIEVYNGGEYTVSPNLSHWTFEPSSRSYSPLAHREFDQDFANGRWTGISEQPTPLSPTLDVSDSSIRFALSSDSPVKVTIYDTAGREVTVLAVWNCAAGNYYLSLPNLESGVYFVRLQTNSLTISKKVIVWH